MTYQIDFEFDDRHWSESSDAWLSQVLAPSMADAANVVASAAQAALGAATEAYFDSPVPFTHGALGMFHARADDDGMVAGVFVFELQAEYLELEIFGGVRRAGDYATTRDGPLLPARDTPLDGHGNIPRGFVESMMQDPRVSWAVIGPAGDETLVRHNEDGSTSFLARIVPETHYDRRFPFFETVESVALGMLPGAFADALAARSQ